MQRCLQAMEESGLEEPDLVSQFSRSQSNQASLAGAAVWFMESPSHSTPSPRIQVSLGQDYVDSPLSGLFR